jgi:hypothetical protein
MSLAMAGTPKPKYSGPETEVNWRLPVSSVFMLLTLAMTADHAAVADFSTMASSSSSSGVTLNSGPAHENSEQRRTSTHARTYHDTARITHHDTAHNTTRHTHRENTRTVELLGGLETVENFADVVATHGGVLEARVLPHRLEADRPDVPLLVELRTVLRNGACEGVCV